jgi:hypothetical protein
MTARDRPPNMRVQRTRSSPSALRAPLTRRRLGSAKSRKWFGGLVLVVIAAMGCTSATPAVSAKPAVARPRSSFGQSLSLSMSLGSALAVGDTSVTAKFTLTNNGSAVFEGCFGPSWGVSVIVGGHNAGHTVRVEYPNCDERLSLLPGQKIVWSKTVPLRTLRAGMAKVTGGVKVVDPAACDQRYGCHEVSVASQLMTIAIGEK